MKHPTQSSRVVRADGRHRWTQRTVATTVVTVLIAAGGAAFAQASPGQSVVSLRQTDAEALAKAVSGRNVDVREATFVGSDVQAGRFSGFGDTGLRRGVALSTGSVIPADPESAEDVDFTRSSILGPNVSLTTTGDLGGEGSPELEALFGATTYDAAVLTMRVVPRYDRLRLTYVFGSEEYAGWSERDYTDSFAILVDGKPCSYVPRSRDLVSTSTINETTNAGRYRQNFAPNDPGAGQYDTELNGFTTELTCEATVRARRAVTVTVAIADTRDGQLDSTVLLARDGLTSERSRGSGGGGHGGGHAGGHGYWGWHSRVV